MADALVWSGWTLAGIGALLTLLGALGVLRFPDVYTRIHAASITDTGGATLMLLGLGLLSGLSFVTLKLAVIWAFLMLTGPAAAQTLANAAFTSGYSPWTGSFRVMRAAGEQKPEARKP